MGTREGYYPCIPSLARLRLIYGILDIIGSYGRISHILSNILRSEISGIQLQDPGPEPGPDSGPDPGPDPGPMTGL